MAGGGGTTAIVTRHAGPRASAARAFALLRVLTSAAVRSAAPVGAPLYFGVAVVASILFGPNALTAKSVTTAMDGSPALALGLFGAWILLALPIARAAIDVPQTFFLRALPVPRWQLIAVSTAHIAAVEAPWVLLWARGDGALAALTAASAAVGAHGLMIAAEARTASLLAVALVAVAAAPAVLVPGSVKLAAGLVAASMGASAAFRRAPERAGRRARVPIPRAPAAALAISYLIAIRRGDAGVLVRAILMTAAGGVIAPLVARGHDIDREAASSLSALSLGIAGGTVAVSASGIAAAVLRAERRSRWLLDSSGTGGGARVLASAGAAAACGSALGILHSALVSFGAARVLGGGASPGALAAAALSLRLIGAGALWGAVLGALAAWTARQADAEGPREGGRALARFVLVIIALIIAVTLIGELAVAAGALAAAALLSYSARGAAIPPEPLRAHRHAR